MSSADSYRVERLLAQSTGAAQAELNRLALSLGLATAQTDAATVRARIKRAFEMSR